MSISDITSTFNKRNRPSLTDKSYDIVRLKALVYNDTRISCLDKNFCIKEYIQRNIPIYTGPNRIYEVIDQDFKACLLNEAALELSKALYNWAVYKRLVSKGLWSWAYVTLYYSQFYCINGLINIQGGDFSRPILAESNGDEKQVLFQVYPVDINRGIFNFDMSQYKPHETIWERYYTLYRSYRYKAVEYNSLYEFDNTNKGIFLKKRHYLNYDLRAIFDEFVEYRWGEEKFSQFSQKMEIDIFESYNTGSLFDEDDDKTYFDLEFYASLRIKLLFDMLNEILSASKLIPFRNAIYANKLGMLQLIKDDTPVINCLQRWIEESSKAS